jgi:hypothetical protein
MADLVLIPNGDNTVALSRSSGTLHYALVDDPVATPDDLGTYVYERGSSGAAAATDLFNLPDHGSVNGVINSVRVYHRHRCNFESAGVPMYSRPYLRVGGTDYAGTQVTLSLTWTTSYTEWSTNPDTGLAWAWSDIDSLIAGVRLTGNSLYVDEKEPYYEDYDAQCTQVYVLVNYTPGWSGKMSGVASPAKIMGVAAANIATVKGVA